MDIKLKQVDIEAALKRHIIAQGFNLNNKLVTIDFTAGRKAGGLIADVSIEDEVKPGLQEQAATASTSTAVSQATSAIADAQAEPLPDSATTDPVVEETAPAAGKSLFA